MKKEDILKVLISVSCSLAISLPNYCVNIYSEKADIDTESEIEEKADVTESDEVEENKKENKKNDIDNKKVEMESKKKNLEKEVNEISKKKKDIDNKAKDAKTRKNQKLGVKRGIDDQVAKKSQEIVSLSKKITSLNRNISEKQNEISDKEKEIEENKELLKDRLRASFMSPKISQIEAIREKDKYSELLSSAEYQAKISAHDKKLVDDLSETLKNIQEEKSQIESNKRQVESAKSQIEEAKKELDKQSEKMSEEVFSIEKEEQAYLKDAANLKKQMDALQAEINRICKELASKDTVYVGGELAWPVPGFYGITSPYGPRSFDGFHTGTDISGKGIYGKNVVAANDGKIIFVNTGGRSLYGNYIIVDHGGGITTLYAHLSSVSCSLGQAVTKGQTIGLVGSTGNSSGPHLHFEVRKNGKHTNPMAYFKKR